MKRFLLMGLLALLCLALGACSSTPKAADTPRPSAEVAADIEAAGGFEELTALGEVPLLRYLDIGEEMLADGEMRMDASRATAECIVVLTAPNQEALPDLQDALRAYRDVTLEQYRDYRPEEVPKLEAAVLKTKGLQTVLIVAKDAQAAEKALDDAWKK